ncbi:MAG: hypothetical protein KDA25_10185 [Phycisphaerales bacterium]|nr:hypothetical protein [Phycisphaerales bacterium]
MNILPDTLWRALDELLGGLRTHLLDSRPDHLDPTTLPVLDIALEVDERNRHRPLRSLVDQRHPDVVDGIRFVAPHDAPAAPFIARVRVAVDRDVLPPVVETDGSPVLVYELLAAPVDPDADPVAGGAVPLQDPA